jgi:type IV secretory pathway TrbL component
MNALNDAFFLVTDKIIAIQEFFMKEAWVLGRIILLIALISAAINYALTGEGLKSNLIKIGKAVVFFALVMAIYPRIISGITAWTFTKARDSAFSGGVERELDRMKEEMSVSAEEAGENIDLGSTENLSDLYANLTSFGYSKPYSITALTQKQADTAAAEKKDPREYFAETLVNHTTSSGASYWAVPPQAALGAVMLIAGDCIDFADGSGGLDFGRILKGLLCAVFVILVGVFCVLEYLIAFMEFMFVSSVGIILFPFSLWDGTKFLAEKLIGAIIGFFVKLLFASICIFLMLYLFWTLAHQSSASGFVGNADQLLMIFFTSLLTFYLCKSAPGLAQSLLTGTPSLSATGAISAVGGAVAAAAGGMGLARGVAGGMAKGAFAGGGMLTQAGSAAKAVGELGGTAADQKGAFFSSLGSSAREAFRSGGGGLVRSLLADGGTRTGSSGGGGGGINRHSQRQQFLTPNADGTKKTFSEQRESRRDAGTDFGENYMAKQEAERNKEAERTTRNTTRENPPVNNTTRT